MHVSLASSRICSLNRNSKYTLKGFYIYRNGNGNYRLYKNPIFLWVTAREVADAICSKILNNNVILNLYAFSKISLYEPDSHKSVLARSKASLRRKYQLLDWVRSMNQCQKEGQDSIAIHFWHTYEFPGITLLLIFMRFQLYSNSMLFWSFTVSLLLFNLLNKISSCHKTCEIDVDQGRHSCTSLTWSVNGNLWCPFE